MTLEQLREVHQARPFKPFRLQLADGDAVSVPHPEFMWFHPRGGRTVFVAGPKESVKIIDVYLVAAIEIGNGRTRKPRNKRS